jgi:CHAT domain-containing protein
VHLLDEFDVAYTPSAQGLAAARRAMHRQQRNVVSLVGVGNPLPHPQPLPYARAEIEEVANYFSQRAHPLYEENASRAGLLDKLGETSHVHLACHGVFDPEAPLHSHLQLSHHERLDLRDLLYGEAGRHLHHVRLVVLSACQTALTDFRRLPDEAIGLPTGFLQAGAPGVVGTLWSVDDLSTALLMAKFYALHLRGDPTAGAGPMPPVRALQQAQRWLREVTVGELFEHFERRRALHGTQGPAGVQRVSLALASAVVIRFALEEDPNTRPFDSPYHWAPFICIGV